VLEAVYLFRVVRVLFTSSEETSLEEMDAPALASVALFTALVVFGALLLPALSSMIGPIASGLSTLY
jgi:hypothetical protein